MMPGDAFRSLSFDLRCRSVFGQPPLVNIRFWEADVQQRTAWSQSAMGRE